MTSNQSVSATLRHLQAQPEILDELRAGQVASEESELEEAIRRSLCADYNVVTPSVDSRGIQTPSPTWPEIDLVGPPSRDENSRDIEVRSGTPSPDITLTDEISVGPRRSHRVPLTFHTGLSDTRYERVKNDGNNNANNSGSNGSIKNDIRPSGSRTKRKSPSPSNDDVVMVKAKKKPEAERWTWIESINDPNDIEERHLLQTYCFDFPRCLPKPRCLRSNSPFCLHGLGERRLEGIDETHWTADIEEDITPRCEEKWIGLENLGATCYLNSCLQLWFHNPTIRNLVFRWRDEGDDGTTSPTVGGRSVGWADGAVDGRPQFNNLMTLLQHVFASMMFSLNGVISIRPLVDYLGIDPTIQQDFPEFSSLLRSYIENETAKQADPSVRGMMQNEFQGETVKIISCSKCNKSFQSAEAFYELILTIQGKKDLYECLDAKFESEKMDGNNQYRCRDCGLQDATITSSLKTTPKMLCFQLMRFGFDGGRKKVTDFIKFPEHLQLAKYLRSEQSAVGVASSSLASTSSASTSSASTSSSSRSKRTSGEKLTNTTSVGDYDLVSVLIHKGHSSLSGHYVDCIKEYGEDASSSSASWYTFNDDIVKGPYKQLVLSKAEEETKSRGKIPAGYQGSSNAYVLWYKRRDTNEAVADPAAVVASESNTSNVPFQLTTYAYSQAAAALNSSHQESYATDAFSSATSLKNTAKNNNAASKSSSAASKSSPTETLSKLTSSTSCNTFSSTSSSASSSSTLTSTSNSVKMEILAGSLKVPLLWPESVPRKIREAVEADNEIFVSTFQQSEDAKRNTALVGKDRQQFLQDSHVDMFLKDETSDFEFISKNWLKKGFFDVDKEEQVDTINHSILSCPHNKLDPNKVLSHTKIISKEMADILFTKYKSEGPRFSGKDAMCENCVTDIVRKTQWKAEVEIAKRSFRTLCNNYKQPDGAGRWIGKRSYNQWATIARDAFFGDNGLSDGVPDDPPASDIAITASSITTSNEVDSTASAVVDTPSTSTAAIHASRVVNPETSLVTTVSASTVVDPKSKSTAEFKAVKTFNEDLLCQHGLLEPQLSVRKLIPNAAWEIMVQYFPDAQEFVEDAELCPTCVAADREEQEAIRETKRVAADLKKSLADFLRGDKRPDLRLMHDGMLQNPNQASSEKLYVIPRHFASQLQRFLKSPATDNRPVSMSSILLRCKHDKMMYNLEAQTILDSSVDLVWPKEYEALERNVDSGAKVVVSFVNDVVANADEAAPKKPRRPPRLVYEPPLCFECAQSKLEEKKRQMFEFESEKIFVRKLGDRDTDCKLEEDDDAFKISAAGVNGQGSAYENDPEFQPDSGDPAALTSSKAPSSAAAAAKKRVSLDTDCNPAAKKLRPTSPSSLVNGHGEEPNGHGDQGAEIDVHQSVESKEPTIQNGFHLENGDADFTRVLATLGLPTSFGPKSSFSSVPRARKRRQDKEVVVSSSESLKDLKKKIFGLFHIAPYDQHLIFDETREELVGDDKTLGHLGVKPMCLLLLRADKPLKDGESAMNIIDSKEEEPAGQAGFSGTKLVASGRN